MDKNNPTALANQMSYYTEQKAALILSPPSSCVASNKKHSPSELTLPHHKGRIICQCGLKRKLMKYSVRKDLVNSQGLYKCIALALERSVTPSA